MFALVNKSDNSIIKTYNGRKGITIDENQYPQTIFTLWSEAERNAIDIYTIEEDNSKKKNTEWYINTDITYAFDGSKVTGSYGDATAKKHADTLWTEQDKTDGFIPEGRDVGDVASEGLKTVLIRNVKRSAENELSRTDWYIIRKTEKDTAIPSSITTHRNAVRTKQAEMETAITNASDTPALETLYTRNSENVRPIGDIPQLED